MRRRRRSSDYEHTELFIAVLLAIAIGLLCSRCAPMLAEDRGVFAIEANDPTAILSGCGSSANVGFLYCRLPEGWTPTGEITVVVPPSSCGGESCARVVVFRPDGGRALDAAVPAGATRYAIPWSKLVGSSPLERAARGFWPVLVTWSWLNADGLLEQTAVEGEIRMRVYRAGYQPLGAEPSRWMWKIGALTFRATERGRVSIERDR